MSSLIVTAAGALIATALGTLAAYGLVRLRWPRELNRQLSLWVLSLRMMPPISALIPMVILWGHLHLVDSYLGLILAYIFFPLPLAIWLMQIFLSSIPDEISEAAQVEGASHFQTLLHVVVPLARPGLATTMLLSANLIWNEFLFASQLSGSRTATLPVLIAGFLGDRAMDWGPLAAAGTISVLPMVLIAVVAQRHIVAGLTLGAVKD
jgi:multiple sugar transport system permease protein